MLPNENLFPLNSCYTILGGGTKIYSYVIVTHVLDPIAYEYYLSSTHKLYTIYEYK